MIQNGWVSAYSGTVNTAVVGATSVEFDTFGTGDLPTLQAGDVISVSVTVDGAPFTKEIPQ